MKIHAGLPRFVTRLVQSWTQSTADPQETVHLSGGLAHRLRQATAAVGLMVALTGVAAPVLAQSMSSATTTVDSTPMSRLSDQDLYPQLNLNLHPDADDHYVPGPYHPATLKGDYLAHGVNFSNLLTDDQFVDWDALNQKDVQMLLEVKHSALATYSENGRLASQIIIDAAARSQVNPMVILVTLEKESGFLSRTRPLSPASVHAAMGYAYTDHGRQTGGHNSFTCQVDKGTALLRRLYDQGKALHLPADQRVDYDTHRIQVDNAATWALMSYTPHTVDIHLSQVGGGNYLFRLDFDSTGQVAGSVLQSEHLLDGIPGLDLQK